VSATGTISENGFPAQNIVDDAGGQTALVPGVGTAAGTWQLSSDAAPLFAQLSGQVDAFISQANAVLGESGLTPAQVDAQVVRPLHSLVSAIAANPSVARCLLERLGAWERSAVTALLTRASPTSPVTLADFRTHADLLRVTAEVNADCALPDGGLSTSLETTGRNDVQKAAAARDWSQTALLARELLLWKGAGEEGAVQSSIDAALHGAMQPTTGTPTLLELGRAAYVFGDDADAAAAYSRLGGKVVAHASGAKKKKKRKGAKHPKAKPTATPRPTATPQPKTLEQMLAAGIFSVTGHAAGDGTLTWSPVTGARRYVVAVYPLHGSLVWSWSGTATSVRFGDTSIDGLAGSPDDGWPIPLPPGAVWTVAALDGQGTIVGLKLR
jgi:hypothetical protein